jgi:hypothetical protein
MFLNQCEIDPWANYNMGLDNSGMNFTLVREAMELVKSLQTMFLQ